MYPVLRSIAVNVITRPMTNQQLKSVRKKKKISKPVKYSTRFLKKPAVQIRNRFIKKPAKLNPSSAKEPKNNFFKKKEKVGRRGG